MLIEDALNDFSTVQKDLRDIERAMDKAIASMDRFVRSFEDFLSDETNYVENVAIYGSASSPGSEYYRLDDLYSDYEKIWRQMAGFEKHLKEMGYTGFAKDMQKEMSGLVALMHHVQDYKKKFR